MCVSNAFRFSLWFSFHLVFPLLQLIARFTQALYSAITEAAFDWIGFPSFALMDQVSSCVYAMNHHTGIIVVSGTHLLFLFDSPSLNPLALESSFSNH